MLSNVPGGRKPTRHQKKGSAKLSLLPKSTSTPMYLGFRPRNSPRGGLHEVAEDHEVAGEREERVALDAVKQQDAGHGLAKASRPLRDQLT